MDCKTTALGGHLAGNLTVPGELSADGDDLRLHYSVHDSRNSRNSSGGLGPRGPKQGPDGVDALMKITEVSIPYHR